MKEKIKRYKEKLIAILRKPEMAILPSNIAFHLILALIPLLTIVVLVASSFDISIVKVSDLVKNIMPSQVSGIIIDVISGKGFDTSIGFFNIVALFIASNGMYALINTSDALYKIVERNEIKKRISSIIILFIVIILFVFLLIIPIFDEKEQDIKITPKKIKNDEVSGYAYGFSLSGEERSGFLSGIRYGFFKFGSTMEQMYFTVLYLCTGKISLKMLSGPVGIYNVVSVYSTYGLFSLLGLLALICINVGFINILPLPAMDGGHIFFILIEKIKGSKVDPKIENKIHNIGLILLLILMVVITFNDILRLI